GIHNRLTSATLDTKWYTDVFLQYRRWLNVEDGDCDKATISINGDQVWANFQGGCASATDESNTHDDEWISHSVDLKRKADQSDRNVVTWDLSSDGTAGGSYDAAESGGWNVDDVCLYAPMTPDNRLAIVDFVAQDQGGPIGLSWTNPKYDPVDRVVVTRNV